eukprot:CAMPEP_0117560724 /NCGR_PEP_ID=MMETSP0784-20121206/54025_1 /TAXON_ID=39447 /ORGANISM="" /LENGTH=53 /DNA_ID=CAMNT_0005358145 /DNA_START=196 /DNA_END=357 /DNA_ORIENTATION=+
MALAAAAFAFAEAISTSSRHVLSSSSCFAITSGVTSCWPSAGIAALALGQASQ